MRPVGPEPSETYWMRRALVVAAFLVLLIIILIFLFNLGGRPGQAAPVPTASTTAATSSASARPSTASTEATTAPSTSSAAASASAKTSTKPSTSSSADARSKPSPSGKASTSNRSDESSDPAAEPSDKPAETKTSKTAEPSKSAEPTKPDEPAKPTYAACDPDDLRATIKSDKHHVGVGDRVDFELSVINGGAHPCNLEIDQQSYQLKIFSGTDRIWSSNDCARIEPTVAKILQPEQQVEWSMTWNGKRSEQDANCRARPEVPRPGYYYATSALKGAKPVQFLLVLRG
jgi:hypothetical protein